MKPFQEFRYWARRAPASERLGTMVAGLIVVGLLAWLLAPSDDDSVGAFASDGPVAAEEEVSPSAASGEAATATDGGGDPGSVEGSGAAGSRGAASTSPGAAGTASGTTEEAGCTSPPGRARGIDDRTIQIAVTLVEVIGPAANEVFGVPTPDQQRASYEAVIGDINARGGVACRKLVASYFRGNPADARDLHAKCLEIAGKGVFAVLDSGAYSIQPDKACFAQNDIPYFGQFFNYASESERFHPYLFNAATYERLHTDTAFALRDRGFFDPARGFVKLGYIYQSCHEETVDNMRLSLRRAGVGDAKIVTYDVGCPTAFANPSDLSQAVLKFQQSGVTHVTMSSFTSDFANFSNFAERQRYRPKYGVPDEALISISYGSQRPNPQNIAGAIAITPSRAAEERTPGLTPSAGTTRCNSIYQAAGMPPVYEQAPNAGHICSHLWMFEAAVEHAPTLGTKALAAGLRAAKSVEFSYPQGPSDFSGGAVTGGQFWRATQFLAECECWRVVHPEFRPTYPPVG